MDDLKRELFDFLERDPAAVAVAEGGKITYMNPPAARLLPEGLGAEAAELFGPELAAPGTAAEALFRGQTARGTDLGPLRLITLAPEEVPAEGTRAAVDAVVSEIHSSLGAGLIRLSAVTQRIRENKDLGSIRELAALDRDICRVLRAARNLGRLYGEGEPEPRPVRLELGDLVRELIATVAYFTKSRDVRLEFHRADQAEILADRRLTELTLLELLSNAIKFSEPGGTVTVAVGVSGPSATVRIANAGSGDRERLAGLRDRLGVPLSALDPEAGAGLGLRAARQLAALQGGTVIVQALPGDGGTVVTAAFPLAEPGGDLDLSAWEGTCCSAFDLLIELADVADNALYESRDTL